VRQWRDWGDAVGRVGFRRPCGPNFEGLGGLVTRLGQDPLAGDCFLFVNRLRTRAKVLLWDGTGLVRVPQAARAGAVCSAVGPGPTCPRAPRTPAESSLQSLLAPSRQREGRGLRVHLGELQGETQASPAGFEPTLPT
jgi:hypothetical protein